MPTPSSTLKFAGVITVVCGVTGRRRPEGYLVHHCRRDRTRRCRLFPKPQTLCSLTFYRDTKQPVRVDNECRACLDDIALTLQASARRKAGRCRRAHLG